jgi:hypothetical protein
MTPPPAEIWIEGQFARAAEQQRHTYARQRERVLEALRQEEAVLQVDGEDRHQHLHRQQQCRTPRQQPQQQRQAAEEFNQSGYPCPEDTRRNPGLLEELRRASGRSCWPPAGACSQRLKFQTPCQMVAPAIYVILVRLQVGRAKCVTICIRTGVKLPHCESR